MQGRRTLVVALGAMALLGLGLWSLFSIAAHRADGEMLRRYCDDPAGHVERVGHVIKDQIADIASKRRLYMISAKLLFLLPRHDREAVSAYRERLQSRITEACR